MKHLLICPVCSEKLHLDDHNLAKVKSAKCAQNHLFDFSKQGYLNLLLSQHKKSKHPGDTTDMVQARTHFLSSGFYNGISQFLEDQSLEQLSQLNQHSTNNKVDFNYCDLACGEGFYTHNLHQALSASTKMSQHFKTVNTIGLDISAPAIKAACKRNQEIQWLIASLARTPIEESSQHLVTGLFFHFDLKEVARILKPRGIFIMATTGKKHLIELRKEIYDTLKDEVVKDFSNIDAELKHVKKLSFEDKKILSNSTEILALLKMTPHYWRCTLDKKQHLERLTTLSITIDIQFDIFIRM